MERLLERVQAAFSLLRRSDAEYRRFVVWVSGRSMWWTTCAVFLPDDSFYALLEGWVSNFAG